MGQSGEIQTQKSIKILSNDVVDQIAAGEVVERPAHMIKELVENSVDAGATAIEINFDEGGRQVSIKDNGHGIRKEQMALAFARHATSKISESNDLWKLSSFGFRGEALASISSVSRMTMTSQTSDADKAFQIKSDFGKLGEISAAGGDKGTVVEINDLFENIPARLKFLKSEAAESLQIKNILKALAMAHPHVDFRVRQKSKLLFFWPKQEDRLSRVCQVLEQEQMYIGEGECNGIKAKAIMCAPNRTVKTSRQIWLYVQNRTVQDRSLQAAVIDAYRSLLMHGEYPVAAVWVECPPDEVDVNVHPTKSQVKFRQNSDAYRAVSRAVRYRLQEAPWIEDLLSTESPTETVSGDSSVRAAVKNYALNNDAEELAKQNSFQSSGFHKTQFAQKSKMQVTEAKPSMDSVLEGTGINFFENIPSKAIADEASEATSPIEQTTGHWQKLQVLGQAGLTYIIAQSDSGVIFVDQHAAHERVAYERIMEAWEKGGIETQQFLLPFTVELEEAYVEAIIQELPSLTKLGLDVEQMGPTTLAVQSAPTFVKEKALQKSLETLGREMIEKGGSFAFEKHLSHIAATMACHSVVRAGQALSQQQMQELLVQMDEYPLSSFCPHGRPVYVDYPFQRLEKDFGRIV